MQHQLQLIIAQVQWFRKQQDLQAVQISLSALQSIHKQPMPAVTLQVVHSM